MTAPERICLLPDDGWSWVEGPKPPYEENAIEYVRADLAAVQPAQVQPDPRDEVIAKLVEAVSALGLRKLVAGWNGEDRENPYPPLPPRLGVTLKTNAGAVYAIDAALAALETP